MVFIAFLLHPDYFYVGPHPLIFICFGLNVKNNFKAKTEGHTTGKSKVVRILKEFQFLFKRLRKFCKTTIQGGL